MLRKEVKDAKHFRDIYGELNEDTGMKTYLRGPTDYAKTLKLRFRVGDLGLPEKRRDIPVVGKRTWMLTCARVAKQ